MKNISISTKKNFWEVYISLSFLQNLIFTICGSVFYFALGSIRIDRMYDYPNVKELDKDYDVKLAIGSLAIVNGFVYLVDTAFGVIDLKNDDWGNIWLIKSVWMLEVCFGGSLKDWMAEFSQLWCRSYFILIKY